MTFRAGVVGAAGFAGIELVRLLARHPEFELVAVTSDALAGTPIAKAYPAFIGVTDLAFSTHEETDLAACDVAFLAVPHKAAMAVAGVLSHFHHIGGTPLLSFACEEFRDSEFLHIAFDHPVRAHQAGTAASRGRESFH